MLEFYEILLNLCLVLCMPGARHGLYLTIKMRFTIKREMGTKRILKRHKEKN